MKQARSKAELFHAMGLGPVWELKNSAGEPAGAVIESGLPERPVVSGSLESLREAVSACRACGLCETRKQTVFADGMAHSPLMVIGEAPGVDEDQSGLPFVGRAGQLLDRMLQSIGCSRSTNAYIANVLKCHPPGNRDPKAAEVEQCTGFLRQQIALNQPKILLLVGRIAIQTLLETKKTVGELRGQVHLVIVNGVSLPAVVSYHPAYLMRRPEEKAKAWDDLLLLKQQGLC